MNMHRPQLTHSRQRQAMPGGPSAGRLRVSGHPPGRKSPSLSPLEGVEGPVLWLIYPTAA